MTESAIYRRIRILSNMGMLYILLLIVITVFLWSIGR